jgi:Zn-dependent oligopeptidase
MGFSNYDEYRISYGMVRSVDYANSILDEIKAKGQKQRDLELRALQEIKNQERLNNNLPEEPIYIWDRVYYDRLMREKQYDLDHNLVSEYFPLEHSLGEMFKIYETIFGVHAVELLPTSKD